MANQKNEIARRTSSGLEAIKRMLDEGGDDSSVALFASHHIEEIEAAYWLKQTGTSSPSAKQIIELLELRSHWGDNEDGLDTFDFTLPGEVTDYVLSVRFDEDGEVEDVDMES